MKIWLTLLLFITLFSTHTVFAAETIVVRDPAVQLIGKHVLFFEDEKRDFSKEQVLEWRTDFQSVNKDVFVEIASPSAFWFYFSMQNLSNEDLWMDISNSNLTDIKLFTYNSNFELLDSLHTGCLVNDPTSNNKGFTFQSLLIERAQQDTMHFLLKVETQLVYEVPLFVGGIKEIVQNRNYYDYASVFVFGAFLLMLLYNLFLFFVTKDAIYIYYSFYLGTAIIIGTYLNNFPFIELIIGKNLAYMYLDTWLWLIFFSTALFTIRYFDLKKTDRTFFWMMIGLSIIFFCFGIANLFVPLYYLANVFQLVAMVFYVICLVYSYRLLLRGVKRARLYCAGWTFMMLGAIIYLMVYNGMIPYNAFTRNVSYVGSLLEILIFSIALGRRITDLQLSQTELNYTLVQKNTELLEVNESLDSFNYHVSHDLKTVLNNTIALSRMAKKYQAKKDDAKVEEIIGKLENVAINGSETVQSLLSLGRLDTFLRQDNTIFINLKDELNLILENHNLKELIQVIVDKDEIGEYNFHPKAFESIFLNLLTNSVKYNKNKPQAKIRFLQDSKFITFIYSDNGIGIDLEKYGKKLFKPFERAGTEGKYEGTGVGLYLVKRIVTSLQGEITVNSELGAGSEFIVKFKRPQS